MKILDGSRDVIIDKALKVIKVFEGFQPTLQDDIVGVPTIGFGTTDLKIVSKYSNGEEINKKVAESYVIDKIKEILPQLEKLITRDLGNHQIAAIVSFVYNLGIYRFETSSLLRAINSRADAGVIAYWFYKYHYGTIKGQSVEIEGLLRRRICEAKLFTNGRADLTLLNNSKCDKDKLKAYAATIETRKLPW